MANAMLSWDNYVAAGVPGVRNANLYSPSQALPVSNLQNPIGSPSVGWQTVSGVVTSLGGAWFAVETDAVCPMRVLVLARTNLTSAAKVRWILDYDTAVGVGTSVQWDGGTMSGTVSSGQSVVIAPSGITAGTAHCYIDDPANPDGFINVPLAWVGAAWQPATNISVLSTQGRDDQTTEVTTRGGQEYPLQYWQRRRFEIDMQGVRNSEVWSQLDDLDRVSRYGNNCLLVPDPTSSTISRETVLGRLKPRADISRYQGALDRRAWKATITERL